MDGTVLFGFVKVIGISLVPVGVVAALIHSTAIWHRTLTVLRWLHLAPPPVVPPAGPPLEKLAADLRRLRREVRHPRPGVAMARQRGIEAAYDSVLVQTAKTLGVPQTLADLPEGIDREAERLRLEHGLEQAGLSWQVHDRDR
jgi:hypothetical protein